MTFCVIKNYKNNPTFFEKEAFNEQEKISCNVPIWASLCSEMLYLALTSEKYKRHQNVVRLSTLAEILKLHPNLSGQL